MNAILALEDGVWYRGVSVGAKGETRGEVVFNTSMTGYQEVLTDPSYAGQIVTMTCPHIGNYGVASEDVESVVPHVAGFIMREASPVASNWRAEGTLRDYLVEHGIVAIADIDTRALVRSLRSAGVKRGVLATGDVDPAQLVEDARRVRPIEGADLVRDVTCPTPFDWTSDDQPAELTVSPTRRSTKRLRIAVYDYGMKRNIARRLSAYGCDLRIFPATAPATDILATNPDGVVLSNGPGDPAALDYAISNTHQLAQSGVPMFGICLGHQILAHALGGKTFKLKFGHRGANHPVKYLETGRVEMTSQNHGFAVDPQSLPADVQVTHVNLYDQTIEGLRHVSRPIFSVQYHPEASPGPHDADYLFREFLDLIERQ